MKKRQKIRTGVILMMFFLFPAIYYFLSPYLIVEATGKGIVNGSFVIFLSLFVSSLFFGRAYCGWVCPAAECQESISTIRDKKVTRGDVVKWIVWIPWISLITVIAIRNHGYKKIDFLYQTTYGVSITNLYSFITYIFVLALIVLPAFVVGKRSFCHHLCWMAPFMILGRKLRNIFGWPSLQLHSDSDKCAHCHICADNCPMSLPVEQMVGSHQMENTECILCGTCVDGCKNEAINYKFARK